MGGSSPALPQQIVDFDGESLPVRMRENGLMQAHEVGFHLSQSTRRSLSFDLNR